MTDGPELNRSDPLDDALGDPVTEITSETAGEGESNIAVNAEKSDISHLTQDDAVRERIATTQSQYVDSFVKMARRSKTDRQYASDPIRDDTQPIETSGSAAELRRHYSERVLNIIYLIAGGLGILAYLINLGPIIQNGQFGLVFFYTLAIIVVLVLAFLRRANYTIRAVALLAIIFTVGVFMILSDGLYGNGRIFLVIFPVVASALAGRRGRWVSIVITLVTVVVVALLMINGSIYVPTPTTNTANTSPLAWTIATAALIILAAAASYALDTITTGLEGNIFRQQLVTEDVERERTQMERRVAQRSEDLERRLLQIRTAAEITRTIGSLLDINELLPQVCDLIKDRFNLYYVGIFLTHIGSAENSGRFARGQLFGLPETYAVLTAGTGEAGRKMLAAGHKLQVGGDSMIGWATANRQARIALDVGQEAVRFENPNLPNTRSELALPIISQDRALGALTIQSERPAAFDENDIIVLQGIADSIGTAIENARLFAEVQDSLEEIQGLHRQYLERAWGEVIQSETELAYTYTSTAAASGDLESTIRTLEVPIKVRDQVIGSILLEAEPPDDSTRGISPGGEWTPAEIALIENIAAQAAQALENARLIDETQRRAEQERLRASITGKVWAAPDIDAILRTTIAELGKTLQASEGTIQLELAERQSDGRSNSLAGVSE